MIQSFHPETKGPRISGIVLRTDHRTGCAVILGEQAVSVPVFNEIETAERGQSGQDPNPCGTDKAILIPTETTMDPPANAGRTVSQ